MTPSRLFLSALPLVVLGIAASGCSGSSGGGFGPLDTTPPSVLTPSPTDAATGVGVYAVIQVVFDEPILPSSVSAASFTVSNGVTGTVQVIGDTVRLTPSSSLPPLTTISVTLAAGTQDLAGNPTTSPTSWSFTTIDPAAIITGAYYVDPANLSGSAADSNDGRLVAEGGTGPWSTFDHALGQAEAGAFSPGDVIYLRGGTHMVTQVRTLNGGGTTLNAQKIRWIGYPGEVATVDTLTNGEPLQAGSGFGPIIVESGNHSFEDFQIYCERAVWTLTGNAAPSPGVQWINISQPVLGTNTGYSDNSGVIQFNGGNAVDYLVERCFFQGNVSTGPGGGTNNGNGSTLYFVRAGAGIVRNSVILSNSAGHCFIFKYAGGAEPLDGRLFENNLIGRVAPNGGAVLHGNGLSHTTWRNNIIFRMNNASTLVDSGGFTGVSNSVPPGSNGWFYNNLFYYAGPSNNLSGSVTYSDMGSPATPGTDNQFFNNIFMGNMGYGNSNSGAPYAHNHRGDYNLYRDPALGITANNGTTTYPTITDWQAALAGNGAGFDEANSQSAAPIFAVTPDPTDPNSFRLDATSPGYQDGPGGADLGPDTSLVCPWY